MDVEQIRLKACHWALLRLAGAAPDDLLTQCRRWLAQGRVVDVARATARAAIAHRVGLAQEEVDVLADLLVSAGDERPTLRTAEVTDEHAEYGFAATRALMEMSADTSDPVSSSALMAAAIPEDAIDTAAIEVASAEADVLAVWRSWRFPPGHLGHRLSASSSSKPVATPISLRSPDGFRMLWSSRGRPTPRSRPTQSTRIFPSTTSTHGSQEQLSGPVRQTLGFASPLSSILSTKRANLSSRLTIHESPSPRRNQSWLT